MLRLLRQDPAVRSLPRWLIVAAVTAISLLNFITFIAIKYGADKTNINSTVFALAVWSILTLYLIFGEVGTRCSPFDMALPISTRKLWLSHVCAVVLAGVAILTVTAGLTAAGVWLLWKLLGKWLIQDEEISNLAALVSAGLILAVVILQTPNPPLQKISRTWRSGGFALLVMGGVFAVLISLMRYHPAVALGLLAAAAAVGYLRVRAVGEVFTLVPLEAENAGEREQRPGRLSSDEWAAATARRSSGVLWFKWFVGRTVQRCSLVGLKRKLSPWFTAPFLVLFGALLSALSADVVPENMRYYYVAMAVYIVMAFTSIPLDRLGMVDALPIPRRFLFVIMLLPSFVMLAAGYGVGQVAVLLVEKYRAHTPELIELSEDKDDNCYYVHIPIEYCKIAWAGDVPAATSPWGETATVWRSPLFRGSPAKLYLPCGVGPESSLDFVALQLSRAVEAVYNEEIAPEDIKERYLAVRDDGRVVPKGESLTIQADYPHLRERAGGPVFPVIMTMVVLLWMLLLYLYLLSLRAGVSKGKKLLVHWLAVGAAMLLWVGQFILAITNVVEPYVTAGFYDILIRSAGQTPLGTLAVWIACALLSWGAFRVAAGGFERVEISREGEAFG